MMTNAKKILITTESREIFIVRGKSNEVFHSFCRNCERYVEMLTLDQVVSRFDIATLEILRRVEAGEIHFQETAGRHLLICAESLLEKTNQPPAAKENQPKWVLTAAAFDKLLRSLDTNREQSGEKYLLLRRNLVRFFEGRGFSEAEETADEVCNRLARKLDAGEKIENVNQYAYGVARMLVLELYKKQTRQQKALSEMKPKTEILPTETDETELQFECLNRCLSDLSAENRELILTYYQGDGRKKIETRQALAEKLCIPQNALRSRAVRLRTN